jgi:DNA polymerase III subunit beta
MSAALNISPEDETRFTTSIERGTLLRALAHAQGIIEKRNTVPILANILLESNGARLRLVATDLDLYLSEELPASGNQASITVPLHMLHDIVRKLPDGADLIFSEQNGQVQLVSGRAQFNLPILPAGDFPVLGKDDFAYQYTVARDVLKKLLERSRGFMSMDATRYYLNGIFLHVITGEDGQTVLRAVATDGHRLARADAPAPADIDPATPGVILPRKTVAEIYRLLEEAPEIVQISLSSTKLRLTAGDTYLISKLVDGKYPEYQKAIPTQNSKELHLTTKAFASAVDRVATVSVSEKVPSVKLHVEDGKMRITSSSASDSSKGVEELEADFAHGTLDIGYNPRFLLDVLSLLEGDKASILLNDNASASIITAASDKSALYVLMPMRV